MFHSTVKCSDLICAVAGGKQMTVTKISDKQVLANQNNANLSTGPQTETGKAVSSSNATRHGIFSAQLILQDEEPEDFRTLVTALQVDLRPVGALELTLVERIAVTIWRQRRLVRAETARLNLARRDEEVAADVNRELDLGRYSRLSAEDLVAFDPDQVQWCRDVLKEGCALEQIDLPSVAKHSPLIHAQLKVDCEDDYDNPEDYLDEFDDGLTGYIDRLMEWCRDELRKAERRPELLAIAEQMRAKSLILSQHDMELLSRYQTTLDNQLYKALRAYRQTQEWRLKTLDGLPTEQDVDAGQAA